MSLFLAIHVEGHRREDGVQGQVHPSEEDVHVLVLDPHVRAPEREAAEPARRQAHFLQDLRLGLVGDVRRLCRLREKKWSELAACKDTSKPSFYGGIRQETQFNTKLSQWKKIGNELRPFGAAQGPLDHGLHVGRAVARLAPAHDAPWPARRPFS